MHILFIFTNKSNIIQLHLTFFAPHFHTDSGDATCAALFFFFFFRFFLCNSELTLSSRPSYSTGGSMNPLWMFGSSFSSVSLCSNEADTAAGGRTGSNITLSPCDTPNPAPSSLACLPNRLSFSSERMLLCSFGAGECSERCEKWPDEFDVPDSAAENAPPGASEEAVLAERTLCSLNPPSFSFTRWMLRLCSTGCGAPFTANRCGCRDRRCFDFCSSDPAGPTDPADTADTPDTFDKDASWFLCVREEPSA